MYIFWNRDCNLALHSTWNFVRFLVQTWYNIRVWLSDQPNTSTPNAMGCPHQRDTNRRRAPSAIGETVNSQQSGICITHRLTNKDKIALRYCYSTTLTWFLPRHTHPNHHYYYISNRALEEGKTQWSGYLWWWTCDMVGSALLDSGNTKLIT